MDEQRLSRTHGLGTPLPRRVAVLRALPGLGDLLCIVPALRALHAALPEASVTLIGLPWARAFVERFPAYIDDFIPFPGYPGLAEGAGDPRAVVAFFAAAQERRFDLALQMHGSGGISNPIAVLLGARHTAGFYEPDAYCPDAERFLPFPADRPEICHHLALLALLGIPARGTDLEFPVHAGDREALRALPAIRDLAPGAYVCIHPGYKTPARRWTPAEFAAVADGLAARGCQIVLTGTAGEADATRAVASAMRASVIDLAGSTTLGMLAALYADARLLVCNDTGVAHLAVAVRLPSIVIFASADTTRWGPLDRERHRAVWNVTPDGVLREADDLLGSALNDNRVPDSRHLRAWEATLRTSIPSVEYPALAMNHPLPTPQVRKRAGG